MQKQTLIERVCAWCGRLNVQGLWGVRTWIPAKCEKCGRVLK